ncbi:uncharacterized mitochondrial protein AtMg00820-like [Nicotiana tomentosiformis]|uniref:uncharacterized mitochondrial protein AtMg00820-like n=1 Tax=Nicotiana tomentosiformis TaxID=4098 RepID=UPI00388C89B3
MKTRGALKKKTNIALISQIEPKKVDKALKDSSWVQAMQEEFDQFDKNQVWTLVPKPGNATIIGTKWVFRKKLNEEGKVIRNKERLVALGYSQQEGVDYDEIFAPGARLESIHADLTGDKDDRKVEPQLHGKSLIFWNSKKQGSVALTTTEAEYIAIG